MHNDFYLLMHCLFSDLIKAQTERKDKLLASLTEEKNVLAKLQQEIAHLRSNLPPLIDDVRKPIYNYYTRAS